MSRIHIAATIAFAASAASIIIIWPSTGEESKHMPDSSNDGHELSTFTDYCSWHMEPPFERTDESAHRHTVGAHAGMWRKDFHKPSDSDIRKRLTRLQYWVTQKEGTERPFANDFWDNHADGIYVDVVSGEPLFSSKDKYQSGTGWPSFTRPMVATHVVEKSDNRLFWSRTEVRSKHGESHLGHVFKDGPAPTGLRYCLNSAALRFIPAKDLERLGYGQFASQFARIDNPTTSGLRPS